MAASFVALLLGPIAGVLRGQQTYLNSIGIPSFSKVVPIENGFINVANGNLHLEIPLGGSYPQRGGGDVRTVLMYDSNIWLRWYYSGYTWQPYGSYPYTSSAGGWKIASSGNPGNFTYSTTTQYCPDDPTHSLVYEYDYSNFAWTAPDGSVHVFGISTSKGYDVTSVDPNCPVGFTSLNGDAFATDRTGYHMYVSWVPNHPIATVIAPDGTQVYPTVQDANGNYLSLGTYNNVSDTLNRTIVTASSAAANWFSSATPATTYTYDVLDSRGSTRRYTVVFQIISVSTNFGQSFTTEYSGNIPVVQEIDLPDGTKYQFSYDSGTTAGHYGAMTSMTLPTGGQVSYGYTNFVDSYGNYGRWLSSRTTSGTGITGGNWLYTPQVISTCTVGGVSCQQKVTVTTPSSDDTVYTFNFNGGPWATQIQNFTGSASTGTLLSTVAQSFDYGSSCPANTDCIGPGAAYVVKQTETTTLPIPGGTNLNQSKRYTWDSSKNGNMTKLEEWNFYTGSLPATVDRTTNLTYLTGSNYTSRNIINRPTNATITDKNGSTVSQTLSAYDGSALTSATGTTQHDDTNFGIGMNYRGNLRQVQRLVSGTSNYLTTSMTYDMTGQVRTTTDSKGNQTTYDYTDNFYDDPGDGSSPTAHSTSTPTNAFLKTLTFPTVGSVTLTTTFGYYWGTGQKAFVTDVNGQTSYFHFYDALSRSTSTASPNGEWTRFQYNSTQTQVDTYTGTTNTSASTSCTVCRHDRTVLDPLGRATGEILVNDPDGQTTVATTYGSSGRVSTVSNPFRSTSDTTYGLETPSYDGLGRTIQVSHADSNVAYTYYGAAVGSGGGTTSQNCSASTYGLAYPVLGVDELGNKRQTWTDGFGRLIETDEPNASGSLAIGTCYTYDLNNNLTGVSNTATSQTRGYSYDLLSRVTAITTPESGTTNLYYTTTIGGSTLCSGSPAAGCLRKDARSITTTYAYDALNRLISGTYSDSTPAVSYYYEQTSYNGLTITNGKGRRTGMSDGSGQTAWNYDSVGNILTETRTVKGVTKTLSYAYNLDGTIATITYPGGRVVAYSESNAQRMTDVKDVANSKNYATGATFAPPGGLSSVLHGYVSGGFAGVTESYSYNSRLEVTAIQATSSAGTALNLAYGYAQSSHNNGNIATQTNNVSSGRTQTYTYDPLNRLLSAQSSATSGGDCWGQSFGNNATPPTLAADTLNNLVSINQIKCSPPALSVGVDVHNQIITPTGYSYDLAGNSTADGSYSYTYDAENRVTSASGMSGGPYCYTYDGNGLRVAKAHGASCASSPPIDVLYWRSISGNTIAETDSAGSTSNAAYHEYIFFGGRRIARSDVFSGSTYFLFADHLGSTRAMTQTNGTVCFTSEYYPYGQELNSASTCSTSYKFTGYERDTETALDYAFARYYNPRIGRFMSGDPLGGEISDPQSLNRYSYVRNNPVKLTDPSGLLPADWWWVAPEFDNGSAFDWINRSGRGDYSSGFGSAANQVFASGLEVYLGHVFGTILSGSNGVTYRPFGSLVCSTVGNSSLAGCTFRGIWIPVVGQSGSTGGNSGGGPDLPCVGFHLLDCGPSPPTIRATPPPPPPPSPQKVTAGCMTGALAQNFLGNKGQAGATIILNVAAYAAAKRLAPALLPGPGWLYVGVATLYDVAQITKSYTDCKYNGGPSPQ